MPLASGIRLGPYEIVGPLGRGGMGEIYRARDTRLGRDVAVKVLPTDAKATADQLSRFEREARAVAALNHPNILALHDIGNESGVVYVVTELLEGETLRDRLDQSGRFTPVKAIDFTIQIARGLAAAHERGFVHRDLKPANVFITREGRVKILDFGLAREDSITSIDSDEGATTQFITGTGIVLGTPGYTSPEQMVGEPATARSDLFALGVVVHEMLTGSHPFVRATRIEAATAVLREDPPPLVPAVPGLPAGTARILERCLAKHSADRPGSARDLALYLETMAGAGDEPSAVRRVAAADLHRIRLRVLAISCGLLVLLSAATWAFVRTMADRAVTAAIDADLARAEQLVRRVQRDRLAALSLTARLVASFPELKALFATDAATVRDYLVSYQQRNPGTPLLVALSRDGNVIARTDNLSATGSDERWIAALVDGRAEPTVVQIDARPYHAAAAAADAGGTVFGYVVAATALDEAFVAALREATQDDVLLLSNAAVLASTLRSGQTPWRTRDEWRRAGGRSDRATDVSIGTQKLAAREVSLADNPPVSVVLLKSRDDAIEPFNRIQNGLVIIGLLGAAVAAIGSLWIARTMTPALQR